MGSISDFLEKELLDHVTNVGAYSQPNSLYVGLSTADPLDTAAGLTEPSTTDNYDRVGAENWDAASGRQIANTDQLTFNIASGSWGTITHYAVFDALADGNMLAHGSLGTSKTVNAGNTPSIAAREIQVDASSGGQTDYLAESLLDHVFKNTAYTAPSTLFIALSNSDPGVDGSAISEPPTGENYDRVAHAAWETASGATATTENSGDITFNMASASWGTVTYMCICDSLAQGNVLLYDVASPNQEPTAGDTVKFNEGDIEITLD